MPEKIREFRVSNDAFDDPAELQRRLADEGYLFFRKLQNPDKMRDSAPRHDDQNPGNRLAPARY